MSVYTRQKAKSKYRNRIRLERASRRESSDTHKTLYDRVKRCQERKINVKASESVNPRCLPANKTRLYSLFSPLVGPHLSPISPHSLARRVGRDDLMTLWRQGGAERTRIIARAHEGFGFGIDFSLPIVANRVQSPVGPLPGIVPDDAVGRRVFSGIFRFPPSSQSDKDVLIGARDPLTSWRCPKLPCPKPHSDRVNVTKLDAEFRTIPRPQERPNVDTAASYHSSAFISSHGSFRLAGTTHISLIGKPA
ncbi:hypothetical protein PR048_023240 [Dryococelus australis]|uniref:Ribosomal protein S14 n=1 Tax=Dryococelus australis TaxID=614101 RepID=A0ABQ9GTI9_9NEOP|nr:hypothetical protein PR048_023240 [Dryococelus australis]